MTPALQSLLDNTSILNFPVDVLSPVVPRILAGTGGDVVQLVVELPEFGESDPLLLAAAALAYSWLDIAESALDRATSELAQTHRPEIIQLVSLALLKMAMSRHHGDPAQGLAYARQLEDLMVMLTLSERARTPELLPLIDYYVAGFQLALGDLDMARWTLERGAGRFRQWLDPDANPAERRVRANCAGQLSWIDAVHGDLRRATQYATPLLNDPRTHLGELGVGFAHLAAAWTHLEQAEPAQARQCFDDALSATEADSDPLMAAAQRLTQMRLALLVDEPETALSLLEAANTMDSRINIGWFADQFLVAAAEAWLAVGEPEQAIATLSPEPGPAIAEARLILVRALRLSGDHRAAQEVMARVPSDPVATSLSAQVQRLLLLAELALEQGNHQRAELMADRALRTASREQLRTAVGSAGAWLRSFVARDTELSRRHSVFMASIPEFATPAVPRAEAGSLDTTLLVPLTTRETDVLKLVADFCSNEEIAADLVLSPNTVKTHMRSLFQKLSVTRRGDAVRRGRALGLC